MAPERLRFRSLFLYFDLEKGISVGRADSKCVTSSLAGAVSMG
jgi:hypothetical protein